MSPAHARSIVVALLAVVVLALGRPAAVSAHAELTSSEPANGTTVAAGFAGPIVLTFSEGLTSGSKAELIAAGGAKAADAVIDGSDRTRLVITLATLLEPGAWTIQWTAIAADRHVERGQVGFTVAAPTAPPTVSPTVAPTPSPTAAPTAGPTLTPGPAESPSPSASPTPTPVPAAGSLADVLVPILAALVLVGAGALLLLRRRGEPA
jgi:methionine-rich copper-binding protein CopC